MPYHLNNTNAHTHDQIPLFWGDEGNDRGRAAGSFSLNLQESQKVKEKKRQDRVDTATDHRPSTTDRRPIPIYGLEVGSLGRHVKVYSGRGRTGQRAKYLRTYILGQARATRPARKSDPLRFPQSITPVRFAVKRGTKQKTPHLHPSLPTTISTYV